MRACIKPFNCDMLQAFTMDVITWALSIFLSMAFLIRVFYYPSLILLSQSIDHLNDRIFTSPPSQGIACEYSRGNWIPDNLEPLYTAAACHKTITNGANCMKYGRPDTDYLHWRWKPERCVLPRFDPEKFLRLLKNKHLASAGDSLVRNQLESLVCMLSSFSPPILRRVEAYNRHRTWHFPSHNVSISSFWSPFLVRNTQETYTDKDNRRVNFTTLYLDSPNEAWAREIPGIDVIVLSIGRWFVKPAVHVYGDSLALGCHDCPGLNYHEIGFLDAYREAYRTSLNAIIDRKGGPGNPIDVILTTYSPGHFEGDWRDNATCTKTGPYTFSEEMKLEWSDEGMRKIGIEELGAAEIRAKRSGKLMRFQALDISVLSLLRPDGHPGPYAGLSHGRSDCVHWCLPGPIDTWNEIMLEIIKKWESGK